MSAKKLEDYLKEDPKYLTALIAFKVDDICDEKLPAITEHLKQLNNKVSKHDRHINKLETINEVEEKYGLVKLPMSKKKIVVAGGGAIGLGGLVFMAIYYIGAAQGWWA